MIILKKILFTLSNIKSYLFYSVFTKNNTKSISYNRWKLRRINIKYILGVNIKDKKLFFINSYFGENPNSFYSLTKNIKSLKNNLEIYFPNRNKYPPLPLCNKDIFASDIIGGGESSKIFFTVENVFGFSAYNLYQFPKFNETVGLWVSYEYNEFDNYVRFPLGLFSLIGPHSSYDNILNIISLGENARCLTMNRLKYNSQSKLIDIACLVASHDKTKIRSKICNLISSIDNDSSLIVYAGRFRNNTNDLKEKYDNNKIEFLRNFQFNICPENTNNLGYVTEKLYDAIFAGCIPIYWGSHNLPDPNILNLNRILFYDEKNPKKLIDEINRLMSDEDYANEFLQQNVFVDKAADEIYSKVLELRHKMEKLGIEFNIEE